MLKSIGALLVLAVLGGGFVAPTFLKARGVALGETWDVNTDLRNGYAETVEQARDPVWQQVKQTCIARYRQKGGEPAPIARNFDDLHAPEVSLAWNRENAFLLTCHMTEQVDRLCAPPHKEKLVRLIRGHFSNVAMDAENKKKFEARTTQPPVPQQRNVKDEDSWARHGLDRQETPPRAERSRSVRSGSTSPDMDVAVINRRFDDALRGLVAAGYLSRGDFATLFGMNVPTPISAIIGDTRAGSAPCAGKAGSPA